MDEDGASTTAPAGDVGSLDAPPLKPDAGPNGEDAPLTDGPNSRKVLVRSLEVRRNLIRGLAVGVVTALLAVIVFVLFPAATDQPPALYALLAFVLATTTGALVATLLVANRARTLSKKL